MLRNLGHALLAASLFASSPAAANTVQRCTQLRHDQGLTGLEPGVWASDLATVSGFVVYAADARPSPRVGLLIANLVSLAPYLSATLAGGCAVAAEGAGQVLPAYDNQRDARAARSQEIRLQAILLAMNAASSGTMLLLVQDPGPRTALGIAAAFPSVYVLINLALGRLSPERAIDDSLPFERSEPELRVVPSEARANGSGGGALQLQLRF